MANNIAFQPMGKTYKITANNAGPQIIQFGADYPVNQYLLVSHEAAAGQPSYVRLSATSANATAPTSNTGGYGIPIPPLTTIVFTGPQCSATANVFFSAITESGSAEIYITPGEGL